MTSSLPLHAAPVLRVHQGRVTDPNGTPLGSVRDAGSMGWRNAVEAVDIGGSAGFARTQHVFDAWERPMLTVARSSSHVRRPVTEVRRSDGAPYGSITIESRKGRPNYVFRDPYENVIGAMQTVAPRSGAPSGSSGGGIGKGLARGLRAAAGELQAYVLSGTYDIADQAGAVICRIDPEKSWPATDDDPYTVRFEHQAVPEPLRTLALAAALCPGVVRGSGN